VVEEVVLAAVQLVQGGEGAREVVPEPLQKALPLRRLELVGEALLEAREEPLQGDGGLLLPPLGICHDLSVVSLEP